MFHVGNVGMGWDQAKIDHKAKMTLFLSLRPVKRADHATFGLIDASVFTRRVKQTRNMVGCADYPSTRKSLGRAH